MNAAPNWERIIPRIAAAIGQDFSTTLEQVARATHDPLHILIATIISLRTKDEVTFAAAERLFACASTAADIASLSEERIAALIYPAGFYRVKAAQIRDAAIRILGEFGGTVPRTLEDLTRFRGVGRKTANLTLGLGFGIPAICVDVHVHRIANRTGWVRTRTPEQTEFALMKLLPQRYWIPINEWLVGFGQRVCTAVSPRCSVCPLGDDCQRVGVTRSR